MRFLEAPAGVLGRFKPLLDPGGGFASETAVTRHVKFSKLKRL
jgi:hypothetical protein